MSVPTPAAGARSFVGEDGALYWPSPRRPMGEVPDLAGVDELVTAAARGGNLRATLAQALVDVDERSLALARLLAMATELAAAHARDGAACSCGTTAPCPTERILTRYGATR